jgi:tetratricopeptide (TPR) repeat protein
LGNSIRYEGKSMGSLFSALAVIVFAAQFATGQVDALKTATGMPISVDARIVFGRVALEGLEAGKLPRVYVVLTDRRFRITRTLLDRDGYYYFRDANADGATVTVEVDGAEVARQTLLNVGPKQQRMDFYVTVPSKSGSAKPGTISAKNLHVRTKENAELMEKAVEAIEDKKPEKAIPYLNKLLANDPADHPAWTILGAAYSSQGDPANAERAFLKALEIKPDAGPTLISLGQFYFSQKRFDPAIEILEKATQTEPTSAVAFRLLGEAYLQTRKGSKAIPALNEAIRLQPIEMADCHLLLAKLYDLAGAKQLASAEFKMLLKKMPDHLEKEKIKSYIRENAPP